MFTSTILDPKGNSWTVSLQILPKRRGIGVYQRFIGRLRRRTPRKDQDNTSWLDLLLQPVPDSVDDFWLLLIIIASVILFYFVGWPIVLLLIDFIWLILVLIGALIAFIVLKRPITITATTSDQTYSWKVQGLMKSVAKKRGVMQSILSGSTLDKFLR
jgi:hypothetical protein